MVKSLSNNCTMKIVFFLFIIPLMISCSTKKELNKSSQVFLENNYEDLKMAIKEDVEVIKVSFVKDTMHLVLTNSYLFYPFGEYKDFNLFYNDFSKTKDINIDSTFNIFKIIKMRINKSCVIFIENFETGKLEIFSGQIYDPDYKLVYGVQVGMSKKDFFLLFFNYLPKKMELITVVKFESGLDGILHYYSFENNKLHSIKLNSDYSPLLLN